MNYLQFNNIKNLVVCVGCAEVLGSARPKAKFRDPGDIFKYKSVNLVEPLDIRKLLGEKICRINATLDKSNLVNNSLNK